MQRPDAQNIINLKFFLFPDETVDKNQGSDTADHESRERVDQVRSCADCDQAGEGAVRRLANKVGRIDRLVRVDSADRKGRNQAWRHEPSPQGVWLLAMAAKLNIQDSMPKRILLGRHLIASGYKPAGWFSEVLDEAFEAQMDGVFIDEATGLVWLQERMARRAV